ncbi:MAG: hypothetical protein M0R30_09985 [Methanoregula sp.]|jgi:hypothetical protein|uniref:hypothetical protein n=1 Tax=Methanoregula sp. TaxID=2052170 RepID=UPI0025F6AFC5|nr:hypothetical protein [Methanoregula sp.]MCK9631960.1 hypothetical protein [Methanoregula sp.]
MALCRPYCKDIISNGYVYRSLNKLLTTMGDEGGAIGIIIAAIIIVIIVVMIISVIIAISAVIGTLFGGGTAVSNYYKSFRSNVALR